VISFLMIPLQLFFALWNLVEKHHADLHYR